MSRADEIRSALRQSGEPMLPRELCDALGMETREDRAKASASVAAMATQGHGVERLDDGRYTLIPGWVKAGTEQDGEVDDEPASSGVLAVVQTPPATAPDLIVRDINHVSIPEGAIKLDELGDIGKPGRLLPIASEAPSAGANQVAERILEYLRGDADYNLLQLLRDAREEIMQLECATRFALEAAEQLAERLRAATR